MIYVSDLINKGVIVRDYYLRNNLKTDNNEKSLAVIQDMFLYYNRFKRLSEKQQDYLKDVINKLERDKEEAMIAKIEAKVQGYKSTTDK